jgi:hypothetical protein
MQLGKIDYVRTSAHPGFDLHNAKAAKIGQAHTRIPQLYGNFIYVRCTRLLHSCASPA